MTNLKDEQGVERHCSSCHMDMEEEYMAEEMFWEYSGDEGWDGKMPPEEKRFCCCDQVILAEKQGLKAKPRWRKRVSEGG